MSERVTPCIHQITLSATTPSNRERVVALGFFDGVHLGHMSLLSAAKAEAQRRGAAFAVFTFSDCGDGTYKKDAPRLTEWETRLQLLRKAGVELVYAAEFLSLAQLSPREFVRDVLCSRLQAACAVCGFNFRFGHGASAGSEELCAFMKEAGGDCIVLPPLAVNGKTASSTAIREAIEAGDIEGANDLLGRPFSINFPVIHGKMLGRKIGVPTINQEFPLGFVIPRHGVYACLCKIDGVIHPAVSNVGVRPTVEKGGAVNCESHILDFDGWLYGRRVSIAFLRFLRGEQCFHHLDALVSQIEKDIEVTRAVCATHPYLTPERNRQP